MTLADLSIIIPRLGFVEEVRFMLDLREILNTPGAKLPFDVELGTERLEYDSVAAYTEPVRASGEIINTAGVLTAKGEIIAHMRCVCDRCGREFDLTRHVEIDTPLAPEEECEDGEGSYESETYPVIGDGLDIDDMLETAFILDMPTKFLCREDCKGLCPKCGKNLNDGDCDCRPEVDPRFAVLEQLLDK